MKRIFVPVPEDPDYARFPQFVHEEVERNGAIIEEVRQLSKEEILSRASGAPTSELSDNSGRVYPSPDYRDGFAKIDELEEKIDKVNVEQFKEKKS